MIESTLLQYLPIAALVIAILAVFFMGYVKASPNEVYVISGLGKKRYLTGRAGIKIPFIEKADHLTLTLIPIDVKTSAEVPTADFININVDAAVNIQIGSDTESLDKASANFLNKKEDAIAKIAREVLEGNMREIIGRMRLHEMVQDRQKFAELVRENAQPDLAAMGLVIVSFNIQNFNDKDDVITNLGVDNIVSIRKNAAISRANSERDINVAQAEADNESNDARVKADIAIAEKNNELLLRQNELKKEADIAKAKADAAYKIQEQEQRKQIEITTKAAEIARAEQDATLQEKLAAAKEKALDAEVRKAADAAKYQVEQEAAAQLTKEQRAAEANAYRVKKDAEAAKLRAEADRYQREQEAAGIAAIGKAEAEAIAAKGLAEAEAMEKKAEAYAKYNSAAIAQMVIDKLPEVAHEVALPLNAIDKITIIDSGSGDGGVGAVGGYAPAVLAKTIETVKETTGFDLTEVMKSGTYAAKTDRNVNLNGGLSTPIVVENDKGFCEGCDGINGDCQCRTVNSDFMNPPVER